MATREQVRAFLDRPWSLLRALKDRHNAATIERKGTDAAFRMAAMFGAQAVIGKHGAGRRRG